MAAWPGSLPYFMLNARESQQDGAVRTDMETGPAKVRQRFTAVSRYLDCEVMLATAAQRATFDTFFFTTLANGSLTFDQVDPADGTTQSFRFMAPPEFTYTKAGSGSGSLNTKVRLRLEILP